MSNTDALANGLQSLADRIMTNKANASSIKNDNIGAIGVGAIGATKGVQVVVIVKDYTTMAFKEQVELMSRSSIVIGMHGAGIANSVYMPIGTRCCCGVIEIFPEAGFKISKGYENMVRRVGHRYERLDVASTQTITKGSSSRGTSIAPEQLAGIVEQMLGQIMQVGSCVAPAVKAAPYI